MEVNERTSVDPATLNGSVSIRAGSPKVTVSAQVIPADDVVTEPSTTLKYLRLRNGDYHLYKRVFIVVEGQRHEITTDPDTVLQPEESSL